MSGFAGTGFVSKRSQSFRPAFWILATWHLGLGSVYLSYTTLPYLHVRSLQH